MFDISMNGSKHLVLDRRKFLSVAAGLVAAGVIPKSALALAAPYAFKQGAYDVTVVSDGTLMLPFSVVSPDAKPEDLAELLGAIAQGDKAQFEASPLLLKSGRDVVLLDTGAGGNFGPTMGKTPKASRPPAPMRARSPRSFTPTPTPITFGERSEPMANPSSPRPHSTWPKPNGISG